MICGLENAKEQSKGEQRDVEEDHVEETTKFEITIKELMKDNNTLKSLISSCNMCANNSLVICSNYYYYIGSTSGVGREN